jgi:hypothetical protein
MTDPQDRRELAERLEDGVDPSDPCNCFENPYGPCPYCDEVERANRLMREAAALLRQPSEGPPRRPADAEIDDACMWFRHDFGLLEGIERQAVRHTAIEWLRAWIKVRDGECPAWSAEPSEGREPERCPKCSHDAVSHCTHCGHTWDDRP